MTVCLLLLLIPEETRMEPDCGMGIHKRSAGSRNADIFARIILSQFSGSLSKHSCFVWPNLSFLFTLLKHAFCTQNRSSKSLCPKKTVKILADVPSCCGSGRFLQLCVFDTLQLELILANAKRIPFGVNCREMPACLDTENGFHGFSCHLLIAIGVGADLFRLSSGCIYTHTQYSRGAVVILLIISSKHVFADIDRIIR